MPTTERWRGDEAIVFTATKLAEATSFEEGKPRWTELALYLTDDGTYLISGAGRTQVEGETDRRWLNVQTRPRDVIRSLQRVDRETGRRFLTIVAEELLDQASDFDPDLAREFERYVA